MKLKLTFLTILAAVASLFSPAVFAQQKLLANQSDVSFTFKQMGVPVDGKFTKFDAQITFDASKLATSKVAFTVDIASATLGDKATDAELPKSTLVQHGQISASNICFQQHQVAWWRQV